MDICVEAKEGIKEHFILSVDGEFLKKCIALFFGRCPSFKKVNSWQEWQETFNQLEYKRTRSYVVWRLSSQSYHSEQLAKLLKDRFVTHQTVKQVIEEFLNLGYLNDEAWIDNFIQQHKKRYSLRLIVNKLRSKGLSHSTLEATLEKYQQPAEELQAIKHLLKTRYASKDLTDFKEKRRVITSLMRKGFKYEQIQQLINK